MPDEFGEHLTGDRSPFLHTEHLQIPRSMLALLLFSSVLIFYRVQARDWDGYGRSFIFCSETHFCFLSLFWIVVLMEDSTTAHYKVSLL